MNNINKFETFKSLTKYHLKKCTNYKKIVSQIKLEVPTYKKNKLPNILKKIPISKPGSRFLK